MIEKIILSIHLVAGIVWIGSVFMGTFIDWPTAKESVGKGKFPFRFIVGQGRRVFYSVYFGIIQLWGSGIALYIVLPPKDKTEMILLISRVICLSFMTLFTLYGTFFTWPKMQLATNKEAFHYYRYYKNRAIGTFSFGIIGAVLTLWSY